jgi:hypothetical protein
MAAQSKVRNVFVDSEIVIVVSNHIRDMDLSLIFYIFVSSCIGSRLARG